MNLADTAGGRGHGDQPIRLVAAVGYRQETGGDFRVRILCFQLSRTSTRLP